MPRFPKITFLALTFLSFPLAAQQHNVHPAQGVVPDATTAIAIAVAVWSPIYGAKQVASERPYTAKLVNGQWVVTGSLPKGWLGGVAIAVISKSNGQILRISHGK